MLPNHFAKDGMWCSFGFTIDSVAEGTFKVTTKHDNYVLSLNRTEMHVEGKEFHNSVKVLSKYSGEWRMYGCVDWNFERLWTNLLDFGLALMGDADSVGLLGYEILDSGIQVTVYENKVYIEEWDYADISYASIPTVLPTIVFTKTRPTYEYLGFDTVKSKDKVQDALYEKAIEAAKRIISEW